MSRFSRWLLDLVFPPACIACQSRGFWVCPICLDSIHIEKLSRDLPGIDESISLGSYAAPALRKMITGFKYQSATCLEPSFIELLRRYKAAYGFLEAEVIVPVPSSQSRLLERGFDHVSHLVTLVWQELAPQAEIRNLLERSSQSGSNADLEDHVARKGNVLGAFEIVGEVPQKVLLIDDVVTSGATAGECAQILRKHGAKEIGLFTLASGG